MSGPSTATGSCAECSANDVREHLRPFDHRTPLGGSLQKALLVDSSESALAFIDNWHIGREHNQGYRRSIRLGYPWYHVGSAPTAWGLGNARFVRQPSISIGHKRR